MPFCSISGQLLWSIILTHLLQQRVESFVPFPIKTVKAQTTTKTPAVTSTKATKFHWHGSSMSANDDDTVENNDIFDDWDQEETLLAMNLSPLPEKTVEQCLQRISDYTQSFPFAAVLPVQPLQYLPNSDGGVELKFLRKKTDIKSGIDGGIRFFVRQKAREASIDALSEIDEDEDLDEEPAHKAAVIEIVAKRNSKGQSISKIFAEKLVIQAFVKGMTMGADDVEGPRVVGTTTSSSSVMGPQTRFESPTKDMVKLKSIFHKWM
jgi:hypothetical protein